MPATHHGLLKQELEGPEETGREEAPRWPHGSQEQGKNPASPASAGPQYPLLHAGSQVTLKDTQLHLQQMLGPIMDEDLPT